ncbi:hypothetical protein D0Z70_03540 [Sphingobium terrigena]|uniref:Uncharacterized protein n=1 Tax=Sphingobium terrigena TaxID=2304063 RepID=A0A418YXD1_9SPHN|nr:hypothetical protein [Sphingobium terrigena]RJG57290.1 hypothetical protein D0Z70_03540 [Sphingobium terrigena]
MIRTLIFGAIAGYVGKKLYDDGKLDQFRDDLVARYNQAKADLSDQRAADTKITTPVSHTATPLVS